MYYPCSKNKGTDQLLGYREADLRLCFRICKKPVFSLLGSSHSRGFPLSEESTRESKFDLSSNNLLGKGVQFDGHCMLGGDCTGVVLHVNSC